MVSKQKYLLIYDYGQGGIWVFMYARSSEEIIRKYPELKVIHPYPNWLVGERLRDIEEKFTFDIDDPPNGWLESLVKHRNTDAAESAADDPSIRELKRYAKQSEARVRSGLRLVGFLLVIAAISAVLQAWPLAYISGSLAGFFALTVLVENWNARRKRRQAERLGS